MRKTLLAASTCGLLLATLLGDAAHAVEVAAPACTVDSRPVTLDSSLAATELPRYEAWLADTKAIDLNHRVQADRDAALGLTPASTLAEQLSAGLIGTVMDHATQTIVTVVTPDYRDASGLQERLDTAGATARVVGVKTRTMVGCHSAAELVEAERVLHARAWHADAAKAVFSFGLDPRDSRFHVGFDPRFPQAAQALRDALGGRVVVDFGDVRRDGRLDDGEPHFGGAGIRAGVGTASNNTCTAGFIVKRNSDGRKGGVTAGHCFANGQSIYSGPNYWGASTGEFGYPDYDMIAVLSSTETYDNVIHSDPCCPVKRNIIGRYNPLVGDLFCQSGMKTKATCNIEVLSLLDQLCDADGCTTGLMSGWRNNEVLSQAGDSGAPVYYRSGTANAYAIGMHIGSRAGGTQVLSHRIATIEAHLGVTLLTS
ncbi:S1 family peptidase [Catellatospora tritici]|uniref:S1 family peptidase n=1 Tax=Catellatospora tritici TaxID=2851566 RepID=UPI001C2D5736|nr:S1 family peptidase [Catellatospora tritici]MBV1852483.1 S1 family peptidase [Catellatospora tritici]